MKETEEKDQRSEKVRALLGEVPATLQWLGIAVVVIIVVAIVAAVTLLPYPYSGGESILRHFTGY